MRNEYDEPDYNYYGSDDEMWELFDGPEDPDNSEEDEEDWYGDSPDWD